MSDRSDTYEPPRPRVVMAESDAEAPRAETLAPQVIATVESGRILPPAPVARSLAPARPSRPRRAGLATRLGLTGLAAGFVGWLGIDAYLWIASVFDHGAALGWLAAAAVGAGIGGAGLITVRELRSFLALKSVEVTQRRIAAQRDAAQPADIKEQVRSVLALVPKDRQSAAAIEAFQRQVQRHHTPAQQLELLSQTVMAPLDRRAEAIVRRASVRAFAIVAISPTAITDALFFMACSVRMVRDVARCYGHRPTAAATLHLLRRLVVEAGRLGAIDLATATFTQHIAGALAERVAANAAESVYASQRMARLGLVTMELCRPVPFRPQEIPGITSSLIGNLLTSGVPRDGEERGDE
jgi:putative membrane protein